MVLSDVAIPVPAKAVFFTAKDAEGRRGDQREEAVIARSNELVENDVAIPVPSNAINELTLSYAGAARW